MKLIPTVICLPLHNPVRLFEDLAMVDVLSHGRLELGIGKGITPFEHLQFGHDPDEASDRAREMQTMLLRAWETGIISSEGSTVLRLPRAQAAVRPAAEALPAAVDGRERRDRGSRRQQLRVPLHDVGRRSGHVTTSCGKPARDSPDYEHPHVTEPTIAQCQGVFIADTVEEAERRGREVWADYSEQLMRAHGRIPPHLQTAVPDVMDNPVAKAQLVQDPVEVGLSVCGTIETVT